MDESQRLAERGAVCVIAGGANGIGRRVAADMSRAGRRVAVLDIDRKQGMAVANNLPDAAFVPCDLTDASSVSHAFAAVRSRFDTVDHLVFCPFHTSRAPLHEMSFSQWRATIAVVLDSAFLTAKNGVLDMLEAGRGGIVFVTSLQTEVPLRGEPAYVAGKAGLIGLTRQLAVEYGPAGVRVNSVSPGVIEVDRNRGRFEKSGIRGAYEQVIPLRSLGSPEVVSAAITFLLSESARYITGIDLPVDGGLRLSTPLVI